MLFYTHKQPQIICNFQIIRKPQCHFENKECEIQCNLHIIRKCNVNQACHIQCNLNIIRDRNVNKECHNSHTKRKPQRHLDNKYYNNMTKHVKNFKEPINTHIQNK